MWKCGACQNENKDEYRFCLTCGEPRPQPAAVPVPGAPKKAPKKAPLTKEERRGGALTVLLLFLALLLIAAIVVLIVSFPRLFSRANTAREESVESAVTDHVSETPTETNEERGGTSSFVFGEDDVVHVTPAPAETAAPTETNEPSPTPAPTVVPTAAPTPVGDYLIPDSNSRYITEDDLKNLSWEQCCLARNEIFARHGRIFVTPEIAAYFSGKSWYRGTVSAAAFSESVFNEYEKANISFISRYEAAHWGGSYY